MLVVEADFPINPKVTVIIQNDIDPHPIPLDLTVHCKSKNDDLGFHTLAFGGIYSFRFRPLVFPRWAFTLFFCSFTWKGSPYLHYLDIYDEEMDTCKTCGWKINKNGGCKLYKGSVKDCHQWKSVQLMDGNSTSKM